jgi:uncharacterized protein involved in propanediol utilization
MGTGRSIAQHGELFQGQVEDESGELRRCLVSLPCQKMHSQVMFYPDRSGSFRVNPPHKQKALKAAQLTLTYLDAEEVYGTVSIQSAVPESKGYGSSTADCVAAARAAADALGCSLPDEELARVVVEAEVASDNFMFRRAVLFAHRDGIVLEEYAHRMPKLEVLGIDTSPDGHVETLKHPVAQYSWRQLQSFGTLRCALRRAIRSNDIKLLGRVATASARINEVFLPKPLFKEVRELAEHSGALGVAVAHSGTVLSILLDPADELLETKIDQIMTRLQKLGVAQVLRFQT